MPEQHLYSILNAGNNAPSGENCQPWHFVKRADQIEIHLLPERDQSAYSWGQRASYMANGAVIENMVIAASGEGYRTEVQYFPTPTDSWHVATLSFNKDATLRADSLAKSIATRISNRKPYKKEPLTKSEQTALESSISEIKNINITLIDDSKNIETLARVGSTNEEIMLANKNLHNFFFSHVSWTKEDDEKNKTGFYIKTLELPPPAEKMFKLFSNWGVMRVLAKLGFTKIIAKQNAATNAAAAAFGAIIIKNTEPLTFVEAGRAMERVWLTATSLGLSFQPLTGILFFKLKINGKEADAFSTKEQELIKQAYRKVNGIFSADDKHVAFMFRIGKGAPPSAHAIRFPLQEVISVV